MIRFGRNIGIILLLLTLGISSCSDWLDEQPIDELVQDNFWQTKEDVESVLMSAYATFAQMDESLFLFGELRSDMIEMRTPTTDQRRVVEGNLEPDNRLCDWSQFYKIINYCNLVLEFSEIAQTRDGTFTPYQLKVYTAEALFLRSLSYFYLVRIFKEVPFVTQSAKTDDQDFNLPKSDEQQIIDAIILDLEQARLFAPDDFNNVKNNIGRARKDAIYALLADVYLWNFEYEKCITYCNLIIESQKYYLIQGSQWYMNYYPGNSFEAIFEFQHEQGLKQPNKIYSFTYLERRFIASQYALELLSEISTGDIVRSNGSFRENDFVIWKYAGTIGDGTSSRPSSEQYSCNWIVYRLADILLMKAEALGQLEQFDEAIGLVNQVRKRVYLNSVEPSRTKNDVEDFILEERSRELAFEGKRWFDLLRMGRRNNYERKADLIDRIVQFVPAFQRPVFIAKLSDPYGWYFPIYYLEIEANMNLVQNPYYFSFTY